ncbi:DUF6345 domain-containing protein [Streptomyces sp. fd1-xmd]|uniref:DUF6345 domain-containing protein n=1 Tax=Streptomyces sp. fd1-xmd TaxID=1812480 RepID=UPI001352091F|nr:DUF6345 domain-containing protein [Streptomyces sp. fd1-xmd]
MNGSLRLGVGWSTHFDRPWPMRIFYRRLRYAYRAPSLFVERMLDTGSSIGFLRFDEELLAEDLDGTRTSLADAVDFLYLSTHGETKSADYKVVLHGADWSPAASGLGAGGPVVAVFDTCDLLDLSEVNWMDPWSQGAGSVLRLILGFASPAAFDKSASLRGAAFAENLQAGIPIAQSWLIAVHQTSLPDTDVGVAIAIGDDDDDADYILHHSTLDNPPAPRTGSTPSIKAEVYVDLDTAGDP